MTTPIDELDGQEINIRLAAQLGWKDLHINQWGHVRGIDPDGIECMVPLYHFSLDMLLRDVWPVCKERGWHWRLSDVDHWGVENPPPLAEIWKGDVILEYFAPEPALALARAMLAVLEAGE